MEGYSDVPMANQTEECLLTLPEDFLTKKQQPVEVVRIVRAQPRVMIRPAVSNTNPPAVMIQRTPNIALTGNVGQHILLGKTPHIMGITEAKESGLITNSSNLVVAGVNQMGNIIQPVTLANAGHYVMFDGQQNVIQTDVANIVNVEVEPTLAQTQILLPKPQAVGQGTSDSLSFLPSRKPIYSNLTPENTTNIQISNGAIIAKHMKQIPVCETTLPQANISMTTMPQSNIPVTTVPQTSISMKMTVPQTSISMKMAVPQTSTPVTTTNVRSVLLETLKATPGIPMSPGAGHLIKQSITLPGLKQAGEDSFVTVPAHVTMVPQVAPGQTPIAQKGVTINPDLLQNVVQATGLEIPATFVLQKDGEREPGKGSTKEEASIMNMQELLQEGNDKQGLKLVGCITFGCEVVGQLYAPRLILPNDENSFDVASNIELDKPSPVFPASDICESYGSIYKPSVVEVKESYFTKQEDVGNVDTEKKVRDSGTSYSFNEFMDDDNISVDVLENVNSDTERVEENDGLNVTTYEGEGGEDDIEFINRKLNREKVNETGKENTDVGVSTTTNGDKVTLETVMDSGVRKKRSKKKLGIGMEVVVPKADQAVVNIDNEKEDEEEPQGEMEACFGCYLCPFASMAQADVVDHWMSVHVAQRPYMCPHCTLEFGISQNVFKHIKTYHPTEKQVVTITASTIYQELIEIERCDLPDDNLEAPTVEVQERGVFNTGSTQEIMHEGLKFQCASCEFYTTNVAKMRHHIKHVHIKVKPYYCAYCSRSFFSNFDCKRHLSVHHPKEKVVVFISKADFELTNISVVNSRFTVLPMGKPLYLTHPHLLRPVGIPWETIKAERWKICVCRRCNFKTHDQDFMWHHVRSSHQMPIGVTCPKCDTYMRLQHRHRSQGYIECVACCQFIVIYLSVSQQTNVYSRMYICVECNYRSRERSGIVRHIKYQHLKCQPFSCPYCLYKCVEKPKVRIHIMMHHPKRMVRILKDEDIVDRYGDTIRGMYKELELTQMEDISQIETRPLPAKFQKDFCVDIPLIEGSTEVGSKDVGGYREETIIHSTKRKFRPKTIVELGKHCGSFKMSELTNVLGPLQKKTVTVRSHRPGPKSKTQAIEVRQTRYYLGNDFKGSEHYRCELCNYRCLDRSCMSRHIKYIHLKAHPHSCPYCDYSNVEKTKVKMHVVGFHAGNPSFVHTDSNMISKLSQEVKKYFLVVSEDGHEKKLSMGFRTRGPSSVCKFPISKTYRLHGEDDEYGTAYLDLSDDEYKPTPHHRRKINRQVKVQIATARARKAMADVAAEDGDEPHPEFLVMNDFAHNSMVKMENALDDDGEDSNWEIASYGSLKVKTEPATDDLANLVASGHLMEETEELDLLALGVKNVVQVAQTDETMDIDLSATLNTDDDSEIEVTGDMAQLLSNIKQTEVDSAAGSDRTMGPSGEEWTFESVPVKEEPTVYMDVDHDPKLNMTPVVVVEDVLEKIFRNL